MAESPYTPFFFNGNVSINNSTNPSIQGTGNLIVNEAITSKRSNEKYNEITLASSYSISTGDYKYLMFKITGPADTVILPNATNVTNGWSVFIQNWSGSISDLIVRNNSGVLVTTIASTNQEYEFFLTNNSTIGGSWDMYTDTIVNKGSGARPFIQKSTDGFEFRTFVAGTGIQVNELADTIEIVNTTSGAGEINTASNLGTGEGVYSFKFGTDLAFKSLVAGPYINMSSDINEITIEGVPPGEINTASNIGTGEGVYASKVGVDLEFKSIVAGANVTITSDANEITINAPVAGEVNTASNIGAGEGVYATKVGSDLEFKSLVAGTNISLSSDANEITINSTGGGGGEVNTASNLGAGTGVFATKVGTDLQFKSLVQGSNMTISSTGTEITLSGPVPGEVNTASNLGAGSGVYATKVGDDLQFKSLVQGSNITLTSDANTITITSTGGGGGTPGGSTNSVQYNNSGSFGGAGNIFIEDNNLRMVVDNTPAVASAGGLNLFGRSIANRAYPAFIGPSGVDSALQPLLARNKIAWANPIGNATTLSVMGIVISATGTAKTANVAVTTPLTWARRLDYRVTTASATAVCGFRSTRLQFGRGNTAGQGGFTFICRFGPSFGVTNSSHRLFIGLRASTAAATDVNPSTQVNIIGIGYDDTDTNFQFIHNDNTGAASKIDLGATFPKPNADTTFPYEVDLFCAPNGSEIHYQLVDLTTNDIITGSVTTDIPSVTQLLTPNCYMSVGGVSSVVGLSLLSMYIETDY